MKDLFREKRESSCEYDFDESLKKALHKRFDIEERAYHNLVEHHENFEELPQAQRNTLLHEEENRLREEEDRERMKEKSTLRTIKTLRTKEEIKDAQKHGIRLLKQKVKPSKEIRVTDLHIKNKENGEIAVKPYTYHNMPTDERYKIVKKVTYYPYSFPSKVAAYVLPDDLEIGERVILEDLIEDIVGASHSEGTYRLENAEAVWNGKTFDVDCNKNEVSITFG
jgi:hypothetical protein